MDAGHLFEGRGDGRPREFGTLGERPEVGVTKIFEDEHAGGFVFAEHLRDLDADLVAQHARDGAIELVLSARIIVDAQHGGLAGGVAHAVELAAGAALEDFTASGELVAVRLGGVGRGDCPAHGLFVLSLHGLIFLDGAEVVPARRGIEETLDAVRFGLEAAEEMFDQRFDRRGNALNEGLGDNADAGVLVGGVGLAEAVAHIGHETFVGDADVTIRALFADDERRGAAVGTVMRVGCGDVAAREDIAVPNDEVLVVFTEQAGDVREAAAGLEQHGLMHELHFRVAEATGREDQRPGFRAVVRVDDETARTRGMELVHRLGDHRPSADWQQGLGAVFGERTQARAEAGSEEKSGAREVRHGKIGCRLGRCRRSP